MSDTLQYLSVAALPLLFAITLHEAAHGWVAKLFGDTTAQVLGRLTLNPIKHIDPVGTILVPGMLLLLGGFMFGWAKPVPVNTRNLRNPKRDMAVVAVAGPMANLLMAVLWAVIMKLGLALGEAASWVSVPIVLMGALGILLNVMLMVLNLLPIPPLDGGRVLSGLLPNSLSDKLDRLEPYGVLIVLGFVAAEVFGLISILMPTVRFLTGVVAGAFGMQPVIENLFS